MPREPEYFKKKGAAAIALWPLSLMWRAAAWARRNLALRPYRAGKPVVCVGNLVSGGSGKTPVTMALAKMFMDDGWRVGIVSRGYGRRCSDVMLVKKDSTVAEVGDEPFEMAVKLPKALIAVGANRAAAARLIEREVDVILMDDGLQNLKLEQDFRIAVFSSFLGVGNGLVLPAGPLREPLSRLAGVDAIVITGNRNPALERELAQYGKPVFNAPWKPRKLKKGLRAAAFAGIGGPEKWFAMLAAQGVDVVHAETFPDHHNYTRVELEKLLAIGLPVLTTMKDFVKIPEDLKPHFTPVYADSQLDTSMFGLLRSTIISRGI